MGQRLTTHPVHPRTGQLLEALYVSPRTGREFYPILGASEDDDGNGDDDAGNDDDADADEDDSGDSDDGDDADKDDKDGDDAASELERVKARMKAADRRASKAEAKVKEFEDANKSEADKAKEAAEAANKERDSLKEALAAARLQVAFLATSTHTWADPEDALELAQRRGYLEDVVDEEDGSIDKKALKAALDKLAKEKPHLVKASSDDDDDDEVTRPPATPGSQKKKKKSKADLDEAKLRRKYPALNT